MCQLIFLLFNKYALNFHIHFASPFRFVQAPSRMNLTPLAISFFKSGTAFPTSSRSKAVSFDSSSGNTFSIPLGPISTGPAKKSTTNWNRYSKMFWNSILGLESQVKWKSRPLSHLPHQLIELIEALSN